MGTGWGCGISLYPSAERTPCFSATPSIGIGTQPQQPTSRPSPAAQRHNCPAAPSAAPPAIAFAPRTPQPSFASNPARISSNATKIYFCAVQEPKMNAERLRMLPLCNISASSPAICNCVHVRRTLRVLMFARANQINRTDSPRLRSRRPTSRRFRRRMPARPFPRARNRRSSASG